MKQVTLALLAALLLIAVAVNASPFQQEEEHHGSVIMSFFHRTFSFGGSREHHRHEQFDMPPSPFEGHHGRRGGRRACREDASRLCSTAQGFVQIAACLFQNREQLSPRCRDRIDSRPLSKCSPDALKLCPTSEGPYEVLVCLNNHQKDVSSDCAGAMKEHGDVPPPPPDHQSRRFGRRGGKHGRGHRQPRPCKVDADRLCGPNIGFMSAVACLKQHQAQVSAECLSHISQRPIFNCIEDVNKFCVNANSTAAFDPNPMRIVFCLGEHKSALSPACVASLEKSQQARPMEPGAVERGMGSPDAMETMMGEDFQDDAPRRHRRPKGLVIGLSVAAAIVGVSIIAYIIYRRRLRNQQSQDVPNVPFHEMDSPVVPQQPISSSPASYGAPLPQPLLQPVLFPAPSAATQSYNYQPLQASAPYMPSPLVPSH